MTDIVERLRIGRETCGVDMCRIREAKSGCTCAEAADEIERLREAVTIALSALVAANSLLKRSEDEKVKPSRAVASNKIFRLMMADYERAVANARAALEQAQPVAAREKE